MTTQSTTYHEGNLAPGRKIGSDGRTVTEAIEAAVPELKGKVREMVETGKSRMAEWTGGVQGGIRERPLQYVLIAAAVGAVVGLLVGRRS